VSRAEGGDRVTDVEALGGNNLAFVEALYEEFLADPDGVDGEWRELFESLDDDGGRPGSIRPSFRPRSIFDPVAVDGAGEGVSGAGALQARVEQLANAYRSTGHMEAQLDPLGRERPRRPELALDYWGLSARDLARPCLVRHLGQTLTVEEAIGHMRRTYCGDIGVQYTHMDDLEAREWLERRMEASENRSPFSHDEKVRVLTKLTDAEIFEQFIQRKFLGAKSFSLEGGESLVPLLDLAVERAAEHGVEEVMIGMAHRGRLNVLVNVLDKSPAEVFREFEDKDPERYWGSGDVKYHLGHQTEHLTSAGRQVLITLCFNPSHLEFVGPVVMGRVRARQDERGDAERSKVLPIVLHGDAAFAGQGIVQEHLNMSELKGYTTGGTLHVVVNNQIGFTTPPESSRSCTYATDVARMLQAPIFHVNGESPESVVHVVRLAMDFRARFRKDVVIDMYCFRRHGHNEGDEPSFTQPQMYSKIRERPSIRESYLEHLRPGLTDEEAEAIVEERQGYLEEQLSMARGKEYRRSEPRRTSRWTGFKGGPEAASGEASTAVNAQFLRDLLEAQTRLPHDFTPHPKIERLLAMRRDMVAGERPLDWAAGECLAWATLLSEGYHVRLSGQDSGRGTFSHRHTVLHSYEGAGHYLPLCHVAPDQAPFEVWDSPLSEQAVLGFEYGYTLDRPDALVMWEAQFGDFVNGAQVIIDQFITSAEDKWKLLSGLVMLLPHGYEGQGPEHSSARLERFLQLCAEDNIQVVNMTTPAQLFHCLRRQALRAWRKPLVVMTPKSLLRRPEATSPLEDLASGTFQKVIPDERGRAGVKRVLLCSGKVYFELANHREEEGRDDVAILRLEQLYPLPRVELDRALEGYADGTPVLWVQEEPWNMGAWFYLRANLGGGIFQRLPIKCVSRDESASPATGSAAAHKLEQGHLFAQAFGDSE